MQVLLLGAGQLARMMSLASAPLNINICAYDVGSRTIVHPLTQAVLGRSLESAIAKSDVITAEFEHIPDDILDLCQQSGKLCPSSDAIKIGGDRRIEKQLLDDAGVRNAKHYIVQTRSDFDQAIAYVGLPMVLKTALGGYDGKGQWRIKTAEQIEPVWAEIEASLATTPSQTIVAEAFVPFKREVSLVGVRNKQGNIVTYPLAENTHIDGVLALSRAIIDPKLQQQAELMFNAVATKLNYVGVLALEFFDLDGELLVNEIAPRVHNSGHWTQQGAKTCQFENHIRAVCGLALGRTELTRKTVMINILGEDSLPDELLAINDVHIHWYSKQKRLGRKMGHINVCGDSHDDLQQKLATLSKLLDHQAFPALRRYNRTLDTTK